MKTKFGINRKQLDKELKDRRWNWSDLSRAMGISRQALGSMLHAEFGPTLMTIVKISKALGVNYKSLLL